MSANLTPLTVVKAAAAVIHARGYHQPQSRPWEAAVPTAYDVRTIVYSYQRDKHTLSAAAVARATTATADEPAAVLVWCTTPPAEPNDYRRDLDRLARAPHVEERDIALLCSAVAQWHKDKTRAARRHQAQTDAVHSRHQGTEGERITKSVTVATVVSLGVRTYGGRDQERRLIRLRDDHGNVYVWTTSTANTPAEGAAVTITGTVTRHDTYRDTQQTHITRCRWNNGN
ncbi:hypothetical protein ACFXKW_20820 [Streptomyces sp. NPDC059193]|uniref:hypothetical protein n=1 Tax=Streptomyces sp. NPDC059193 TaxID=3346763 RepID=UPI0036CB76A9